MLKTLTISLLSLGVIGVKQGLVNPADPIPSVTSTIESADYSDEVCRAYLKQLVGKWAGGGFFTLRVDPDFAGNHDQLEPTGFEDFDTADLKAVNDTSIDFFYEELHFWEAGSDNLFVPA